MIMNSLSNKISLGYFIIIIINIFIAAFAVYHINQLSEPIVQILNENFSNKYQKYDSNTNLI